MRFIPIAVALATIMASGQFLRCRRDFKLHLLCARVRVMAGQPRVAWLFGCSDPDCTGAAYERERIVADEFGRPREFEADGVGGKRTDRVEFIRDAKYDTRGVGSVGSESCVVGQKSEFLIDSFAGERARGS